MRMARVVSAAMFLNQDESTIGEQTVADSARCRLPGYSTRTADIGLSAAARRAGM